MKDDHPEPVKSSLLLALAGNEVSLERRIDFAQLLMELGEPAGFLFIMGQIHDRTSLPWGRNENFKLQLIDTRFALQHLLPELSILQENSNSRGVWMDVKSVIVNFLFSLATKSEDDLLLVDHFLQEAETRFKETW